MSICLVYRGPDAFVLMLTNMQYWGLKNNTHFIPCYALLTVIWYKIHILQGYFADTGATIRCQMLTNILQGCFTSTGAITVYPKKYAHRFVVLCFVVVMQSFIMNSHEVFIHIHQGCFTGTGAIVRLPQCQWSKPDGYGKISQCITTTKHSKAKTVCIFLGIYCIWMPQCQWSNPEEYRSRESAYTDNVTKTNKAREARYMTSSNGNIGNIFRVTGPLCGP